MNVLRRPHALRPLGAAALIAACAVLAGALPAAADPHAPTTHWGSLAESGFEDPTPSQAQKSVHHYQLKGPAHYILERSVRSLGSVETEGSEQVISLASDILFAPDKWELPEAAPKRLGQLLDDVPDGADVAVGGHTDSVVGAVDNQELSENRARAVADAIASVRPDLSLRVGGFAATMPKRPESGADEDAARSANRRVELRYEG